MTVCIKPWQTSWVLKLLQDSLKPDTPYVHWYGLLDSLYVEMFFYSCFRVIIQKLKHTLAQLLFGHNQHWYKQAVSWRGFSLGSILILWDSSVPYYSIKFYPYCKPDPQVVVKHRNKGCSLKTCSVLWLFYSASKWIQKKSRASWWLLLSYKDNLQFLVRRSTKQCEWILASVLNTTVQAIMTSIMTHEVTFGFDSEIHKLF